MYHFPQRFVSGLLLLCVTSASQGAPTIEEELAALADKCQQLGMAEQAVLTRDWWIHRDPHRQYLFLPPEIDPLKPLPDAPVLTRQWYTRFRQVRADEADRLFELAKQQLSDGRGAKAYQLLHEVLHQDPDHADARRALGYALVNHRWRLPETEIVVKKSSLPHPTLQFPPGFWRVSSEHFEITTNVSAQQGRQLAVDLEELHGIWRQLFFEYWSSNTSLKHWFHSGARRGRSARKHKVVLFRNRQEYVSNLESSEPRIAITTGYYLAQKQTSYFYVAESLAMSTCWHEVTHQLFQETGRPAIRIGERGNAWVIEGIALFMESLRRHDGFYSVGGLDAKRLQYARFNVLNGNSYVPLNDFVKIDRRQLQQDPRIRQLYSQAAGLTHFLMHRESDLVDYVKLVYAGRDTSASLAATTKTPLEELDRQYRQFLDVTDADLAHFEAPELLQDLSLGRTSVTASGLKVLAGNEQLRWLNLSFTGATDQTVQLIEGSRQLRELNLEQTMVTDACMNSIGHFRELQELDLSGTSITDHGLSHLTNLANLKILWLTNCPVTDDGLRYLSGLKQLEYVNLSGSQVTAAGWERLKQQLPNLQSD